MFSPDPAKEDPSYRYSASPTSSLCPSSPYSPYSPASRMERKVSTASSGLQEVDMSNINLQQSLDEFTQLQEKIKKEQDMALSLDTGLSAPFSTFPGASSQPYPSPLAAPAYPEAPSAVKLEPLDFQPPKTPSHTATSQAGSSHLLKQLQDDSFKTKWDLKPFDFGGTTGFISESSKAAAQRSDQKKGEVAKSEVKIEPVLDLAVEQVKKDIESTCSMLGISSAGEFSHPPHLKGQRGPSKLEHHVSGSAYDVRPLCWGCLNGSLSKGTNLQTEQQINNLRTPIENVKYPIQSCQKQLKLVFLISLSLC